MELRVNHAHYRHKHNKCKQGCQIGRKKMQIVLHLKQVRQPLWVNLGNFFAAS